MKKNLLTVLTAFNVLAAVLFVVALFIFRNEEGGQIDYSAEIEMIKRHDKQLEKIDERIEKRDTFINKLLIDFYEIDTIFKNITDSSRNERLDGFLSRRHNVR
mgnify:CR=1 FL=1